MDGSSSTSSKLALALKELFTADDGDGKISATELTRLLELLGKGALSKNEIGMVVKEMDKTNAGRIDVTEFIAWLLPRPAPSFGSPMKVLLTGASGLLGRQIMALFPQRGWMLRGLAFSRTAGALVKCDLFNKEEVAAQFTDFRPDIVIHCAAERRPWKVNEDEEHAMKLNVDVTRTVGELAKQHNAWLIYLSTNYIFDGKAAPYKEDAVPCPVNVYGQSKLDGEKVLAEAHPGAAILRVPLLYGPVEKLEETSVTGLMNILVKPGPIKLDNWQERFPTNTEDLAMVMEAFCEARCQSGNDKSSFSGIFHWQANQRQTQYLMGMVVAEIAGLDTSNVTRIDDAPPPGPIVRPQYERMLCPRLESLLSSNGYQPDSFRSDFKTCLARYLKPHLV
mmetsp:Transcript_53913/g.96528  ORF Transcript_53913/g.96528 Transcript_53913/m.96528 type:complete len:393 (+) Transcript_53913:114-1292(+)|eukprot:CAMPEP_0197664978 /NCGR_PEP_ID=MMETSP1338-20131121/58964_1 /TAXON_ID=43686 ORGANISM="Pelagodinium beii, Strain RCC1491" /NCGR_SAMPLE_ID=MMETSP1338 /ASSEMBLY_ACC=CAM_ASM_000754 /LENGTH=392 /DNA_ID=CAMNT_0043243719 /DNA_START=113 /DNA_END=1291 /DNA_ORIENTATION=-